MSSPKLRRAIAWEAARLIYYREESEYYRAKHKAARIVQRSWVKPADLPSNTEIREQVLALARILEGAPEHHDRLYRMRMRALKWMRILEPFHPKLIGSVLTGHVRDGSDIDIHVFSSNPQAVMVKVEDLQIQPQMERKRIVKDHQQRVFTHIHFRDEFPIELTLYDPSWLGHRFKSSITGKPIERAGIAALHDLIDAQHGQNKDEQVEQLNDDQAGANRFDVFAALLWPLEQVKQNLKYHPEGDALYHSLQVFDIARQQMPYDEEYLLAALLHDIGKAIDPSDHVGAGLEALDGYIETRSAWLIENHMLAHQLRDATLGARARRRLTSHPWYEDLMNLCDADRQGRQIGVQVDDVDQALQYISSLEHMFD